jgi:hypothetical protein
MTIRGLIAGLWLLVGKPLFSTASCHEKIAGLNRWEPVVEGVPDSRKAADGTAGVLGAYLDLASRENEAVSRIGRRNGLSGSRA